MFNPSRCVETAACHQKGSKGRKESETEKGREAPDGPRLSHPQTDTQPCPSNNIVACCMNHHHPPVHALFAKDQQTLFWATNPCGTCSKNSVPACGRASVWSERQTRRAALAPCLTIAFLACPARMPLLARVMGPATCCSGQSSLARSLPGANRLAFRSHVGRCPPLVGLGF